MSTGAEAANPVPSGHVAISSVTKQLNSSPLRAQKQRWQKKKGENNSIPSDRVALPSSKVVLGWPEKKEPQPFCPPELHA